jgi:hypothetical protein
MESTLYARLIGYIIGQTAVIKDAIKEDYSMLLFSSHLS